MAIDRPWLRLIGRSPTILALTFLAGGCTGTLPGVKPLNVGPPPPGPPAVLVLDNLRVADEQMAKPDRQLLLHAFQLGLEEWCVVNHSFEVRVNTISTNSLADALVLTGTITEHVGILSPADTTIKGQFAINAPGGTQLASFTAHTGPSHDTEEYKAIRLGRIVAEFTDHWAWSEELR